MCGDARNWLDYFSAIGPAAIGFLAVAIASQQWITTRRNHKLQLFDKRYRVYKEVEKYISRSLAGRRGIEEQRQFFMEVLPEAKFLFDDEVYKRLENIDNEILDLDVTYAELESSDIPATERTNLVRDRRAKKEKLRSYRAELPTKFKKYLHLRH